MYSYKPFDAVQATASGNTHIHFLLPIFLDISLSKMFSCFFCLCELSNSIGSLGRAEEEQGVDNVTVSNVDFMGTNNGVRIKTWGKDSNSFARNIVFQHINMKMVKNPIIIDQHYCLHKPCPKQVRIFIN